MSIEDYTLRISQATPVQLVIINHEILLDFINRALEASVNGDMNLYYEQINKTKNALTQLIEGLDFNYEIAHELFNLYKYAGERLNKALYSDETEAAEEIKEMFTELLDGWQSIEDTPDERISEASETGQRVYAGLTYGKDGLDEYIPEDETRGFQA